MATYTVTINEKTRHGKGLVAYLRSLGVIDEPNETTLKAIKLARKRNLPEDESQILRSCLNLS